MPLTTPGHRMHVMHAMHLAAVHYSVQLTCAVDRVHGQQQHVWTSPRGVAPSPCHGQCLMAAAEGAVVALVPPCRGACLAQRGSNHLLLTVPTRGRAQGWAGDIVLFASICLLPVQLRRPLPVGPARAVLRGFMVQPVSMLDIQ